MQLPVPVKVVEFQLLFLIKKTEYFLYNHQDIYFNENKIKACCPPFCKCWQLYIYFFFLFKNKIASQRNTHDPRRFLYLRATKSWWCGEEEEEGEEEGKKSVCWPTLPQGEWVKIYHLYNTGDMNTGTLETWTQEHWRQLDRNTRGRKTLTLETGRQFSECFI